MTYVYNPNAKRLHKLPASESCNTDQIKARKKFQSLKDAESALPVIKYCKRCFK